MITLEEAKIQQAEMHAQGQRLLDEFPVLALVDRLGETVISGSFSYNLMIKPDIDLSVFTNSVDIAMIAEIAQMITTMDQVSMVLVSNKLIKRPDPGMPVGVYLRVKRLFEDVEWNFDIWIMKREDYISSEFDGMIRLPATQHDLLLLLKYQLKAVRMYPGSSKISNSFSSADLYRAVLRDNCKSLDDLIEWRKQYPIINQT